MKVPFRFPVLGLLVSLGAAGSVSAQDRVDAVRVEVATDGPSHPISPFIYGASGVDPVRARELGLTAVRWGGNRSSRYNWRAQADNAGSDWFFLNGKADSWADFIAGNKKAGVASYLTVPMLHWVAKGTDGWGFSVAKYGAQKRVESYVADRGDGTTPDGKPIIGNDPRDTSIPGGPAFQAEGIRALLARPAGGPKVYGLDNEPMLWDHTHRDVHPRPATYDEIFQLGRDYARAIKEADPQALVAGPCAWGWPDLTYSAADRASNNADHHAHGDVPFLAWYLAEMKKASDQSGKRLLDLVDVHVYPEARLDGERVSDVTSHKPGIRALRLRSTRLLWDPTYTDESWIGQPVKLIPRIRDWVAQNNPGTGICLGEYSWGGDDDPSGAVAQADLLGLFARERLDHAYYWAGLKGVQRFAFQLYRNPDGHHRGFGDRYLETRSEAPDRLAAYSARRDDGALTVVLVNKDLDRPIKALLSFQAPAGATLYRLPNPPGPIRREVRPPAPGQPLAVDLPPLTAAMLVLPGERAQ
jgi:hypothetical protein